MKKSFIFFLVFTVLTLSFISVFSQQGHPQRLGIRKTGRSVPTKQTLLPGPKTRTPKEIADDFPWAKQDSVISTLNGIETADITAQTNGIDKYTFISDPCPQQPATKTAKTGVIKVPEDYPTIQDAVDASQNKGTIIVNPSKSYVENIRVAGKNVGLVSAGGINEKVHIVAADTNKPVIEFYCGGYGWINSFYIEGGKTGIYAAGVKDKASLVVNGTTIENAQTGIQAAGNVQVTASTIKAEQDAVVLSKADGVLQNNKLYAINGYGIYAKFPGGLKIKDNAINEAGTGAIYVVGGAAIISGNSISLQNKGFGIVGEAKTSDFVGTWEISGNVVDNARGAAIAVSGADGKKTQSMIKNNTAQKTDSSTSVPGYTFDIADGIVVVKATAYVSGNIASDNKRVGILFSESCGMLVGNLSFDNKYGAVIVGSDKNTACSEYVVPGMNCLHGNETQNLQSDVLMVADYQFESPPPLDQLDSSKAKPCEGMNCLWEQFNFAKYSCEYDSVTGKALKLAPKDYCQCLRKKTIEKYPNGIGSYFK